MIKVETFRAVYLRRVGFSITPEDGLLYVDLYLWKWTITLQVKI